MYFLKHLNGIFSFFFQSQWNPSFKNKKNLPAHMLNKSYQSNLNSFLK